MALEAGQEVHVYRLLARHDAGPCPTILLAESTGEHAFTVMTLLPGELILSAVHGIGQNSYGYLTNISG